MSERMKKAELIFVPAPGVGHLVSILEFAKRLIDRDDRILITVLVMKMPVTSFVDAYTKSLTASQPRIKLLDLPEVEPPSLELLYESPEYYITLFMESQLPNVKNIVSDIVSSRSSSDESVRVTGLVLDLFCVSMIDVATELSLPPYIYLPSNAGFLALMFYLPTCRDQICTEFESSDSELSIPGFANPVPVSLLPLALFNKYGYTSYIKMAQGFNDVNGIIVNTFSELEPYAVNSFSSGLNPPVFPVGPVLDLNGQPNPELDKDQCQRVLKWLQDQPDNSVVFLCFGSMGSFSPTQLKEIATGLEQSEHKFLWSIRVSQPAGNEVSTPNDGTGHDIFPEGFQENIAGRGMICGWAPQVEILAHKAIGGFVSHCGWNSILESLWYGVPIATWPLYAEQQLNAFRMVKELGLAVEMKLDSKMDGDLVKADEIVRGIRLVMDGDSGIRKKVKEMSEISKKSLMDGGSSFVSLGKFIDLNF